MIRTNRNPLSDRESRWAARQSEQRLEQLNRRPLKECDKCGCSLCSGCDYDHDCFAAEREAAVLNRKDGE